MKSFSATWTQEKLDAYLAYPRKVVPGTKMKYDGLADSNARGELIQFLSSIN
jgi:cytochrome c